MPDTPKRQLSVSYSSTRLSYPGVSNPATPATGGKDEDFAAVKMQSAFRGHQVRFGQEEERRVQWLNYYIEGLRHSVAESPHINGIYCKLSTVALY